MRSFPSCWNKTLAQLGFRRRKRKAKSQLQYTRRSLFESLEPRQMLTADYIVTTLNDVAVAGTTSDSLWSLREALTHAANDGQSDSDVIEFDSSLFTFGPRTLLLGDANGNGSIGAGETTTQLVINSDVEIRGPGADLLAISANNTTRVIQVNSGVETSIEGLTITGGFIASGSGAGILTFGDLNLDRVVVRGNYGPNGAGIHVASSGSLDMDESTVDDNHASNRGGGINGDFAAGNSLTISNSTISNNTSANVGGGLDVRTGASAVITITNSTFSGNEGTSAGAIWSVDATTQMTIVNTTITDNHALALTGMAGGIWTAGATTLYNTILAGNTAGNADYPDGLGNLSGAGSSHNLIGVAHSGIGLTHGVNGNNVGSSATPIDPKLAPLANYDGPTKTHALLVGSPALDAGTDAYGGNFDQRMHVRKFDAVSVSNPGSYTTDIGSFEAGNPTPLVVTTLEDELDAGEDAGSPDLSLREALALAAELGEVEVIEFDVENLFQSPQIMTLTMGSLELVDGIDIVGPGKDLLIIDANEGVGLFELQPTVLSYHVAIRGLTMRNADTIVANDSAPVTSLVLDSVSITDFEDQGLYFEEDFSDVQIINSEITNGNGRAIYARDKLTLTVSNSLIMNTAGIYVDDSEALAVLNSRIINNSAGVVSQDGDSALIDSSEFINNGIWAEEIDLLQVVNSTLIGGQITVYDGDATIANTTVTGNRIVDDDSVIRIDSGSTAVITNVTVSNNIVNLGNAAGGSVGAAIFAGDESTIALRNSIVAHNYAGAEGPNRTLADLGVQSGTFIATSSYNLITQPDSGLLSSGTNNQFGLTASQIGLTPLGMYGGRTHTYALLPGSLAIDAGYDNYALGMATDQRGFERIIDFDVNPGTGNVDTGAYEQSPLVATGDFNNDSHEDHAFLDSLTESLYVILGDKGTAGSGVWGELEPSGTWTDFTVGDFNGDGRDDLMARDSSTNHWTLGVSDSTQFHVIELKDASGQAIASTYSQIRVGDFDNDGAQELLGWKGANWEVIDYDEKLGTTVTNWGTAVYNVSGVTAASIQVGDVNRDGRDDVFAFSTSSNKWWIGLSNGSTTFTQQDWGTWFGNVSTVISNPDVPIQSLIDIFSSVYNTVELELYQGFMKGIQATDDTDAGNAFDQAALLVDLLDKAGFNAQLVVGTAQADWQLVRDWIGAPDSLLGPSNKQTAVLDLIKKAIDPNATSSSTNISFDHAWVTVAAPDSSGLATITLDPSFKFKDRQPGVLPATDALLANFETIQYLNKGGDRFAAEYYEDSVMDYLRVNHPGKSIADVAYDGPIKIKHFDTISEASDPLNVSRTGGTSYADLSALLGNSSARDEWSHRVKFQLFKNKTPTQNLTPILNTSGYTVVPSSAFDQISITYDVNNVPILKIGNGSPINANSSLTTTDVLTVRVEYFAPGTTSAGRFSERDLTNRQIGTIALNAGQTSALWVANKQAELLGSIGNALNTSTVDITELLALSQFVGQQYWHDLNNSAYALAAVANQPLVRTGPDAIVATSNGPTAIDDGFTAAAVSPFGIVPDGFQLGISFAGLVPSFWTGARSVITERVLYYTALEHEHSVLQETLGTESVSALKALKRAYQGSYGVDESGNPSFQGGIPDDSVFEFYLVKVPNQSIWTLSWFEHGLYAGSGGSKAFFNFNETELVNALKFALPRHAESVNGPNQLANVLAKVYMESGLVIGPPGEVTSILVPQYKADVGDWVGHAYFLNKRIGNGTPNPDLALHAGVFQDTGVILDGGASGGQVVDNSALVSAGAASFHPINNGTVNLANGNLVREELDVRFPNIGVSLDFQRRYNSQADFEIGGNAADVDADLGHGWTHSFSDRLLYAGGDSANPNFVWLAADGARHELNYVTDKYVTSSELKGTFTKTGTDTYEYRERDGMVYRFQKGTWSGTTAGQFFARLYEKRDINDNGVTITYDGTNPQRIITIRDAHTADRRLQFGYNGDGLISSITKYVGSPSGAIAVGTPWTYEYYDRDLVGMYLKKVNSATDSLHTAAVSVNYDYHPVDAPTGFRNLLSKVIEPNGDYRQFEYYLNGRVFQTKQSVNVGADPLQTADKTYIYNLVENTTTVTDERGNIETYRYQQNGLITRQLHADRSRVDTAWGKINTPAEFLMESRSDEVGAVESYTYFVDSAAYFSDSTHATVVSSSDFRLREMSQSVSRRFRNPTSGVLIGHPAITTQYAYVAPVAGLVKPDTITVLNPGGTNVVTNFDYYSSGNSAGLVSSITEDDLNLNYVTQFVYYETLDHKDGLVQTTTNARSIATSFDYDAAGNLTSSTTASLPAVITEYDHNGNVTTYKDETNRWLSSVNDILGRQRSASNVGLGGAAAPLATNFTYDASGQLLATTDPLGRSITLNYDSRNKVVERIYADDSRVTMTYDDAGNLVGTTDELGRTVGFVYDNRNRLIHTIYADGAIESIRYDGAGRVVETTDALDRKTKYTYDAEGRVVTTVNANTNTAVNTATNAYNNLGHLKWTKDFNGNITLYEYDLLGRVVETRVLDELDANPDSPTHNPEFVSTTKYDGNGSIIQSVAYDVDLFLTPVVDGGAGLLTFPSDPTTLINTYRDDSRPLIQLVETTYDEHDRPEDMVYVGASLDGVGSDDATVKTRYDDAGRVQYTYDELNRVTEFVYDTYGRLQETILPDPDGIPMSGVDSPVVTRTYDAAGNVIAVKDSNAHVTTSAYDARNRLLSTTDAEGNESHIVYDPAGQVVATIDALGRATYSAYDQRGRVRLQRSADPDGADSLSAAATKFTYDLVGNAVSVTGPNGYEISSKYDTLNRLEETTTTDVQIFDVVKHNQDPNFAVIQGTSPSDVTAETSFGRDHTNITGTGSLPAKATWTVANLPEDKYTVSLTWMGAATLDSDVTVTVKVFNSASVLQSTVTDHLNQTSSPRDFALDYQGQWRGWSSVATEIMVPTGGKIEVTLTGSGNSTTIRADAMMLDREVSSRYEYEFDHTNFKNRDKHTDTLGRTTITDYDSLGRLVSTTLPDPDGATGSGGPGGSNLASPIMDHVYDGYGNVISVIERRGTAADRTERRSYDKRSRLVEMVLNYEDGDFTTNQSVDRDIVTQHEYDDAGNLRFVTHAVGTNEETTDEFKYDDLNRLETEYVDISAPETSIHRSVYKYDAVGNLTRSESFVEDPGDTDVKSTVTTYAYDDINRLVRQVDDAGIQIYNVNAETQYAYDQVGNLLHTVDPTGRTTSYEYDRLNRLTRATSPDPDTPTSGQSAPVTEYVYDVLGNVARTINGEGQTTQSIYDSLGREISRFDGNGDETRYRYDSEGNLTRVIDANLNATEYVYDQLDRVTQSQIFDGPTARTRTSTFNDAGNVERTVDRNGRSVQFTYDALDRPTDEDWFSGASPVGGLEWTYDAKGRLQTSRTLGAGASPAAVYEESFVYDGLDRVTQHDNFITTGPNLNPRVRQVYAYDSIGNLNGVPAFQSTYIQQIQDAPNGAFSVDSTVTYSTDGLGRIVNIHDAGFVADAGTNSNKIVEKNIAFTYDAAGRTIEIDRESANDFDLGTVYTYDGVGRVKGINHSVTPQSRFAEYTYRYDQANRVGSQRTINRLFQSTTFLDETFYYDNAGQLTTVSSFPIENYGYDANGNRESTDGLSNIIDPNNRLKKEGQYTYLYDNEGNRTAQFKDTDGSSTINQGDLDITEYKWDHRNRLIEVTHKNNFIAGIDQKVEYAYNNDDLRVRKSLHQLVSDTLTLVDSEQYVHDGDHLALTIDRHLSDPATGYLQNRYLYAAGIDELLADENFGGRDAPGLTDYELLWAASDHLGSVRQLVDAATDNVVEHRDFNAFGKITTLVDGSENPKDIAAIDSVFGFAGREWDGHSNLYYNRARWLDPAVGRFVSEDPIGSQGSGTNLFVYAGNDPMNRFDPSGMSWLSKFFDKVGEEVGRIFEDVVDFVGDTVSGIIDTVEYIVENPDDAFKTLVSDPIFWGSLALGTAGFSLGFLDLNLGLSGLNFGPNLIELGKGAFNLVTGGGLNLGSPTLYVNSPLLGVSRSIDVGAFLVPRSRGQGSIQQVQYLADESSDLSLMLQRERMAGQIGKYDHYKSIGGFGTGGITGIGNSQESFGHQVGQAWEVFRDTMTETFSDFGSSIWSTATTATEYAGGILFEPIDWFYTAKEVITDPWSPLSYAGLIPVVPSSAGKGLKTLLQAEQRAVSRIDNILTKNFKQGPKGDISGAIHDMVGNPIPKPGGGTYDHIQDLGNILRGLRNNADTLKNATTPAAIDAHQRALQGIEQIEQAIRGAGL